MADDCVVDGTAGKPGVRAAWLFAGDDKAIEPTESSSAKLTWLLAATERSPSKSKE